MAKFTDTKGRAWDVVVDVWTLQQVDEHVGVLLTSLMEKNGELFAKLYSDPLLLADVGWRICESQAKERDVDVRDFASSILGDSLAELRSAVLDATVSFFADPETRENLRVAMSKQIEIACLLSTEAAERLSRIDVKQTASRLSDYVLSSQGSPASSRGSSHLDN